ncbi:hypothetical protein BCR36DRAFT_583339 [Piromyces finnis]|uniref:Uncharacterized protein n=1 Tax=Piromyces finnis TaxID=1754191 RepID=A0A1Y1VBW6_9FUNG|nr:hypothetical protein BCR36DRAFT_583339 [Piromyces finnis]|eukprot:ORX50756.1 hypothetical protein BCR36DRAFT_583339 [Piromyces finnis]
MKFVNALLLSAIAFLGINAKCVEEKNEEFFLLPLTSKSKAEERCIENGGKLAEVNSQNKENAASAVAACSDSEGNSANVWIKSWNTDNYNNIGIYMSVNKESKVFGVFPYLGLFKKDEGVFQINEEAPAEEATETAVAEEPAETKTQVVEEEVQTEAPEEVQTEEADIEEAPVFVDDGVGIKYEVLCQAI